MRFFVVILLLLFSINSFADAGYGYRFYVQLELNNSEKKQGYIYVSSWDEYKDFGNLKKFIEINSPSKELHLYPNIATVNSDFLNIDFVIENSYTKIDVEEIEVARETEVLDFGGGEYRLKEITQKEFDLIKVKKPYSNHLSLYEILNYCHLIFYSWDKPIEQEMVNDVFNRLKYEKSKLGNSLEGSNGDKFYIFFENLKKTMLKNNILLIQYCESC